MFSAIWPNLRGGATVMKPGVVRSDAWITMDVRSTVSASDVEFGTVVDVVSDAVEAVATAVVFFDEPLLDPR